MAQNTAGLTSSDEVGLLTGTLRDFPTELTSVRIDCQAWQASLPNQSLLQASPDDKFYHSTTLRDNFHRHPTPRARRPRSSSCRPSSTTRSHSGTSVDDGCPPDDYPSKRGAQDRQTPRPAPATDYHRLRRTLLPRSDGSIFPKRTSSSS